MTVDGFEFSHIHLVLPFVYSWNIGYRFIVKMNWIFNKQFDESMLCILACPFACFITSQYIYTPWYFLFCFNPRRYIFVVPIVHCRGFWSFVNSLQTNTDRSHKNNGRSILTRTLNWRASYGLVSVVTAQYQTRASLHRRMMKDGDDDVCGGELITWWMVTWGRCWNI